MYVFLYICWLLFTTHRKPHSAEEKQNTEVQAADVSAEAYVIHWGLLMRRKFITFILTRS